MRRRADQPWWQQVAQLSLTNRPTLCLRWCLHSTAFHAVLSRTVFWWMTAIYWPDFPTFICPSPIWRSQWVDPLELSGHICNGWPTIRWRLHDHRLSRLDTIHQRDRHTDSHVAMVTAAPTHCVGQQNPKLGHPNTLKPAERHCPCVAWTMVLSYLLTHLLT